MLIFHARLLTIFIIFALIPTTAHAYPKASQGILDLTDWSFSTGGIVTLDGEWEFYPDSFHSPESFLALDRPQPSEFISVPGAWNAFRDRAGSPMGGHGFATYRVRVKLPHEPGGMALYIPYVNTAYQLWVNGELLTTNGTIGRSRADSQPQFRPEITLFSPNNPWVDIVFHISNFHFRNGGFPRSLELGPADQIILKQRRFEFIGVTLFGAALIMAFFFACIYSLHREGSADAYFSLFLFSIAVRMLVTGYHLLARVVTDLPWEATLKIEYLTAYLSPTIFLYYLRSIFPEDVSNNVTKGWTAVAVVGMVLSLVLPGRLSSQVIPIYLPLLAILLLYFVYVGFRAAARRRPDSRLFVGGMVVLIAFSLITLLRYVGPPQMPDLIPVGLTALILTQALIIAKRWVRAYHQTVLLAAENAQMLQKTEWQLQKLKEYRRLMTLREENLRRRIADMLHGRTQGRLFAATRRIDQAQSSMAADNAKANELLTEAKNLLNQVREDDIRSTGKQLHPTAVGAGLVAAVESLLDSFEESYQVHFDIDPKVEDMDQSLSGIPYDIRLGIYRIIEEGLNNISKHAEAKSIHVMLSLELQDGKSLLKLTLADDGVGFDSNQTLTGLGLPTIDARVGDLGGTWTFTGSPGQGTNLCILIPLPTISADSTD